jgi:tRNA modification GTPase
MIDLTLESMTEIHQQVNRLENLGIPFVMVGNKIDKADPGMIEELKKDDRFVFISALSRDNLEELRARILEQIHLDKIKSGNTIVTNARHFESLQETKNALHRVLDGLDDQITNDFLAMDIRQALMHLGEITGEITTDDLLANIFSKFCIGK